MLIKKGLRNVVCSIGGQIIILLIGIFVPRLVIVSYGSDINGLLSSINTMITYLSLLEAGIGMATLQALYQPIVKNDKDDINSIISATNHYYKKLGLIYAFFIIIASFIFPLIIKSNLNYSFVMILVLICGAPGAINFIFQRKYITILEASGDNYIVTNLNTIVTLIASILKIVLLFFNFNVIFVQFIYCITSLMQMLYIYHYIKTKYAWINLNVKPKFSALKQKNSALIHQICGLVTNSTDVLILTAFCPLYVVSIYSLYNMMFTIVYNLINSINSSIQFILGQSYQMGKAYYIKLINAYETYYIAITSSLLTTAYIFIIPFLKLYTIGADVNYIDKIFPLLFLTVNFLNSARNASINTIYVSGEFNSTVKHAIIESVLNLGISIFSVYKFGMIGVLFGTIIGFAYRNIVSISFANNKILDKGIKHSIRVIIINIFLMLFSIIVVNKFDLQYNNYFTLISDVIVFTILILSVFIFLNSLFDIQSAKYIYEIISKKRGRKRNAIKKYKK